MPTPGIFDFDADGLDSYDDFRVAEALESHPAVYVNHLRIAQHIDAAATDIEGHRSAGVDGGYDAGYVAALRAVVAALRKADYVPSGPILSEDGYTTERFKAR